MRALVLAFAVTACNGSVNGSPPDAGTSFVIESPEQLDLLFMIDNSSGIDGPEALPYGFPAMLAELGAVPGGLPDLHLGVVSSDLGAGPTATWGGACPVGGDRGVLQVPSGCVLPGGARFASLDRGASTAALTASFECLVKVGRDGCGFEHQLASVARALDPATTENAGFLRPDAHLAIVLLTDEDDCSAPPDTTLFDEELPGQGASLRCALAGHRCNGVPPPAAPFTAPMSECTAAEDGPLIPIRALVDRIRASKADPDRQLTVAGVYGVPAAHPGSQYLIRDSRGELQYESWCSVAYEAAMGLRLSSFVEAFGAAGSSHDLCVDDLRPTLTQIGRNVARRLTSVCLASPPSGCQVEAGAAALPHCGEGAPPCWRLEQNAHCLGGLLMIDEAGALPAGTRIVGHCGVP